jgi:5-amino-6-(5-phosphoribosylamino)uracil reductase
VAERPYVLLSVAMSIDGFIDDASGHRLALSNQADFDRVDEVRAGCDAILVGAGTIRSDDPRLVLRSKARRASRVARGLGETPFKVTLTGRGDLDPQARFFTLGDVEKIVYATSPCADTARKGLSGVATVVDAGDPVDLRAMLADLSSRGVRRLMVEGGGEIHTLFLTSGLVDEIQLVIAPFFVGDPAAPRFVGAGAFPYGPTSRMRLADTRQIGDVVLLRYLPGAPGELPGAPGEPSWNADG